MDREEVQPAIPVPGESWWLLELQKLKIETLEAQLGALEEKAKILASHNQYLQRQNQILLDKISGSPGMRLISSNYSLQKSYVERVSQTTLFSKGITAIQFLA